MDNKKRDFRVVTFLKREELDFLDALSKDIYFSNGINIPRTKLIEEIIDVIKDMTAANKEAIEKDLLGRFKHKKDAQDEK